MGLSFVELSGFDKNDPEIIAAGDDFDDFANAITALVKTRKRLGLTQQQVATAMGTSQSVISDLERVGGNPTVHTLQRYARAVGAKLELSIQQQNAIGWQERPGHTYTVPVVAQSVDGIAIVLAADGWRLAA